MKVYLFFVCFLSVVKAFCQHNFELYNNGSTIFVSPGAEVHVRGDVHMIGGTLTNNGLIETHGNSYSNTLFQQRGTGTYRLNNSAVNTGERQFISGSFAARGGQAAIGVDDGSFYNLELNNDQGIVYLVGTGSVADFRNSVNYDPFGTGNPNNIITHDIGITGAIIYPSNGSDYSAVFGNMNSSSGLVNEFNNTVALNGNMSGVDQGYVIGKLRRAISPSGGVYGFVFGLEPAGVTAQKGMQYVHLDFASGNDYDVIEGYFQTGSDNTIPGTTIECTGETVDYFGGIDHGEWVFNDITGSGAGTYEVKVWPQDDNFPIETIWVITKDNAISGTADQCGPTPVGLARGGMNGFSEFGVAAVVSPLPAEFMNINAVGIIDHIDVNWKVGSEYNLSHYILERSEDALNYEEIATLLGAGNTNLEQNYYHKDDSVRFNQNYYYRVKSVDLNGSYEYSPVVVASLEKELNNGLDILLYPNPAEDNFNILITTSKDRNVSLNVSNAMGQVLIELKEELQSGNTVSIIQSSDWSKGIYFVELRDVETDIKTIKKIVIQ